MSFVFPLKPICILPSKRTEPLGVRGTLDINVKIHHFYTKYEWKLMFCLGGFAC